MTSGRKLEAQHEETRKKTTSITPDESTALVKNAIQTPSKNMAIHVASVERSCRTSVQSLTRPMYTP